MDVFDGVVDLVVMDVVVVYFFYGVVVNVEEIDVVFVDECEDFVEVMCIFEVDVYFYCEKFGYCGMECGEDFGDFCWFVEKVVVDVFFVYFGCRVVEI